MSIRTWDFGASPRARIGRRLLEHGRRIEYRHRAHRRRILQNFGKEVALARLRFGCVDNFGNARVEFRTDPDVRVRPKWFGDLVAKVRPKTLAADAAHHLADQPSESNRVI